MYYYGRYDILANSSVQICISKDEEKTKQNWTLVNDMVLGWVTLVCFMLSILSLVILFITYIIFPELRTLPGKNLTSLAVTLLMSAIFWIISSLTNPEEHPKFYVALIIVQHYFLIASFTSMCNRISNMENVYQKVKSSKIILKGGKLFAIYLLTVFAFPAFFVIICFILDRKTIVNIGYGDSEL